MRIGFIGLGAMGMPIAANYVKAGYQVRVHNRSQGKVQEMVGRGATAGASPADVTADADVVMTCAKDGYKQARVVRRNLPDASAARVQIDCILQKA